MGLEKHLNRFAGKDAIIIGADLNAHCAPYCRCTSESWCDPSDIVEARVLPSLEGMGFRNAYGSYPSFTTWGGWMGRDVKATLDYIMFRGSLKPSSALSFPPDDAIADHPQRLPNEFCLSDHLCLVADLAVSSDMMPASPSRAQKALQEAEKALHRRSDHLVSLDHWNKGKGKAGDLSSWYAPADAQRSSWYPARDEQRSSWDEQRSSWYPAGGDIGTSKGSKKGRGKAIDVSTQHYYADDTGSRWYRWGADVSPSKGSKKGKSKMISADTWYSSGDDVHSWQWGSHWSFSSDDMWQASDDMWQSSLPWQGEGGWRYGYHSGRQHVPHRW